MIIVIVVCCWSREADEGDPSECYLSERSTGILDGNIKFSDYSINGRERIPPWSLSDNTRGWAEQTNWSLFFWIVHIDDAEEMEPK